MTAATVTTRPAAPATAPENIRPLMSLSSLTNRRSAVNAAIAARQSERAHHDPAQPELFDVAQAAGARVIAHPAHASRVASVLAAARAC